MSCTELEAITGIPKSTVHEILRSHLDLRNVYSVWVPHKLSDNNQAARVSACKELKKLLNAKGMDFMPSNYLVKDESWFLWDASEYRRAWTQKKAVKPTIAKQKLTRRKTMVLMQTKKIFCDCFAPRGVCGCPVHDKLPERYREEIPEFEEEQSHIVRTALPDGQFTPAHSSRNKAVPGPEGVPWSASHPTVLT